MNPIFAIVWQFDISEEQLAAFESAYGPDGAWAALFKQSSNYLGTELLRDAYVPGRYLTIDRWRSESDFRTFRAHHDADYEDLDRKCDALTSAETRIGAFVA